MSSRSSPRLHRIARSALKRLADDCGFEFSLFITGQGTLSCVNERLLRSTRHTAASLRGKPFGALIRRADSKPFGPSLLVPRSQSNPQTRNFSVLTRDGRTIRCRGRAYYFAGTHAAPGGLLLLGDRTRAISGAPADLLSGPAGAAAVSASLRDGLCVVDARGTIVSADAALAGLAGRLPDELIGLSHPYPWFGRSDNRRLGDVMDDVARTGTSGHLLVTLEREEDPPLALSFAISPLTGHDGLFLVSVRDISDIHPVREGQMAEHRIDRLKHQLRRNTERLKTLVDVNRSVLRSGSLRDIFRRITDGVGRLVDHDLAGIYVFDGDENLLRPHTLSKLTTFSRRLGKLPLKLGEGIVGSAAISGETVLVNDAQRDPRSVYPPGMKPETEHIIAAPLRGRRSTYGILTVARNRQPGFYDEDAQIVQSFADAASIAIDNVLLHAESVRSKGGTRRATGRFREPLSAAALRRPAEPGDAVPPIQDPERQPGAGAEANAGGDAGDGASRGGA